MNLSEFDKKIAQLKTVQIAAEGMQFIELTMLLENLETKRIEFLNTPLLNIESTLTVGEIAVFDYVAVTLKNSTVKIDQSNILINNVIVLGNKLLSESF
ncbi:MAG: hypothetical protein COB01_07545 [Lutibacter sp.]|nr:MAG: hypothetical protein COB01_07545 [Lutibacter sp.]